MILLEGLRFLWAARRRGSLLPSRAWLLWRLGTAYGTFDPASGQPRPLRALLWDAWRDRAAVGRFLRWRRSMRLSR